MDFVAVPKHLNPRMIQYILTVHVNIHINITHYIIHNNYISYTISFYAVIQAYNEYLKLHEINKININISYEL